MEAVAKISITDWSSSVQFVYLKFLRNNNLNVKAYKGNFANIIQSKYFIECALF